MNQFQRIHRINDVLTALAQEMNIQVTEEFEDEVLNDLTLYVAEKLEVE